jgi:hypothetical protein
MTLYGPQAGFKIAGKRPGRSIVSKMKYLRTKKIRGLSRDPELPPNKTTVFMSKELLAFGNIADGHSGRMK